MRLAATPGGAYSARRIFSIAPVSALPGPPGVYVHPRTQSGPVGCVSPDFLVANMQSQRPSLASLKKRRREQGVFSLGARARSCLSVSEEAAEQCFQERRERDGEQGETSDAQLGFLPTQVLSDGDTGASQAIELLSPEKNAFDLTRVAASRFSDLWRPRGSQTPAKAEPGDTGACSGEAGSYGARGALRSDKENVFSRTDATSLTISPGEAWTTGGVENGEECSPESAKEERSVPNPQHGDRHQRSETQKLKKQREEKEPPPLQPRDGAPSFASLGPASARLLPVSLQFASSFSGAAHKGQSCLTSLSLRFSSSLSTSPLVETAPSSLASSLPSSSQSSLDPSSVPASSGCASSSSLPASSSSSPSAAPSSASSTSSNSCSSSSSVSASCSASPAVEVEAPPLDVESFLRRHAAAAETGRLLLVSARTRQRVEAHRRKREAHSGASSPDAEGAEDPERSEEKPCAAARPSTGTERAEGGEAAATAEPAEPQRMQPARELLTGGGDGEAKGGGKGESRVENEMLEETGFERRRRNSERGEVTDQATADSVEKVGDRSDTHERRCGTGDKFQVPVYAPQTTSCSRASVTSVTDIEDIAEWLEEPKCGAAGPVPATWAPNLPDAADLARCGDAGDSAACEMGRARQEEQKKGGDSWIPLKSKSLPSVTDFSAQLWCERQLQFTLQTGIRRETIAMKKGSVRHLALELYHYQMEEVVVETEEEAMAFKLLNSIQQVQQLRTRGVCRELWVFGPVAGLMARGVIDELRIGTVDPSAFPESGASQIRSRPLWPEIPPGGGFAADAQQGAPDLSLPDWETLFADKDGGGERAGEEGEATCGAKASSFSGAGWRRGPSGEMAFAGAGAFLCPWEEARGEKRSFTKSAKERFFTLLSDNKTRSLKKTPCLAQKQTSALQLQIYWQMVDRLRREPLPVDLFFAAFQLDRRARLTHPLLLASAEAAGVTVSSTGVSVAESEQESRKQKETATGAVGDRSAARCRGREAEEALDAEDASHSCIDEHEEQRSPGRFLVLESLLGSLQEELQRLPPLWKDVHVVYECEGEEFAREKIPFHAASVEHSLQELTSWWRGLRPAEAVQVSEKWKCRSCHFLADCHETPLGEDERATALKEQEEAEVENKRALEEFDEVVALQQEQQRLQELLDTKRKSQRVLGSSKLSAGREPTEAASDRTRFGREPGVASACQQPPRVNYDTVSSCLSSASSHASCSVSSFSSSPASLPLSPPCSAFGVPHSLSTQVAALHSQRRESFSASDGGSGSFPGSGVQDAPRFQSHSSVAVKPQSQLQSAGKRRFAAFLSSQESSAHGAGRNTQTNDEHLQTGRSKLPGNLCDTPRQLASWVDAAPSMERLRACRNEDAQNRSNAVDVSAHPRSDSANSAHTRSPHVTEKAHTSLTFMSFKKSASRTVVSRSVASVSASASPRPSPDFAGDFFSGKTCSGYRHEQKDMPTKARSSPALSDSERKVMSAKTPGKDVEAISRDGEEKRGKGTEGTTLAKAVDRQDVEKKSQKMTYLQAGAKQATKEQGRAPCAMQRKGLQKGKKNEATILEGQRHITRYFATKNTGERKGKGADPVIDVDNVSHP
ncbi:defects in morphology 1 precursor [Toxoplasma gondii p89]|uniref:Defects in morphology 1 n=1 Tax=Toxoplasma gondii p89 TaxID=943119 RepID=A0A086KAF7_TOXGO|nr:defects in morphology 1 precursor [Toxoplasma gondii p89]